MELVREWRAAGHSVEHFSLSDVFPGDAGGFRLAVRQILFTRKARAFVRSRANAFDVIDAITGGITASKRDLNFKGLLVARSVGLFRLYDQFENSIHARWPELQRGSVLGRIVHRAFRHWLRRASERSLTEADLINVPNEEEARTLRLAGTAASRIVVQPYGISAERRRAFAGPVGSERLAAKRVCFIGMWGPRKGSRDWPLIVRELRDRVPGVRFRFLGTMADSAAVLRDLEVDGQDGIELVPEFEADELPKRLADCTVGVFPSYVEGFGLGLLEQLAAGLPSVAYDVPGPRQILGANLADLLVPVGNVSALVERVAKVLTSGADDYVRLSQICRERSQVFESQAIATCTLSDYQDRAPRSPRGGVVFLQSFGLASPGGGPRILRALLQDAPLPWHSICSSPHAAPKVPNETHMPSRPSWGKIDFSRAGWLPQLTAPIFAPLFRRRFDRFCRDNDIRAIHAIPHRGAEFAAALDIARELNVPFFLQVHDDFEFTAERMSSPARARAAMKSAWLSADARFVVSERLGDEYCARYGARPYEIVTDGVESVAPAPISPKASALRVYFMGLFHFTYEPNLRALIEALQLVAGKERSEVSLALRCGLLPRELQQSAPPFVRVLPFGSEEDVARDLENADLLYMPLQFSDEFARFVRFSLSTKMITYLGSGIPILYHGPTDSAAYQLLEKNAAAFLHTSPDVSTLADVLRTFLHEPERGRTVVMNALQLARSRFLVERQRRVFWNRVRTILGERDIEIAAPTSQSHAQPEHAAT
ncbi:MAG: glycosyltransferase family 4 protein [Chthoniobacterales bacterium]